MTQYLADGQAQGLTYTSGPNEWESFFGPSKGPIQSNYGTYRRENFSLPEAYLGSNRYLTDVLIRLVTEQDMWPVKVALPWRLTESEMEIVWDRIIFNSTLLGQVPEEGVSRLVTQETSERRDHYVRYGLAFQLEHGFMKTDRGRLAYRMHLEQIRNAVLDTAYLGVLDAYIRCKRPRYAGGMRSGMARMNGTRLRAQLAQEVEQFGTIQKNDYGFDVLDNIAKKALKAQANVKGNMWIVPEGMRMYLNTVKKENFQAFLAGDTGGAHPLERAKGTTNDVVADVAYDCAIFETKSFEMPNMPEPMDPLIRPATIGEYYTMQNHLRGTIRQSDYTSGMRDIFIYNEDKDMFTRITMTNALRNSNRFDLHTGKLLWPASAPPFAPHYDENSNGVPSDMFICADDSRGHRELRAVDVMGEIHPQYLRDAALNDWADSVMYKLMAVHATVARDIRDGIELCRRIDNAELSASGAQKSYATWLYLAHVLPRVSQRWDDEHGLPVIPAIEDWSDLDAPDGRPASPLQETYWYKLAKGMDNNPAMYDAHGKAKFVPVGYGNWAGIKMLASERYKLAFPDIQPVAARFVAAMDVLYSELTARTRDSFFLDGKFAPSWMKARDGRSTLFGNLMYVSFTPVMLHLDGTQSGTVDTSMWAWETGRSSGDVQSGSEVDNNTTNPFKPALRDAVTGLMQYLDQKDRAATVRAPLFQKPTAGASVKDKITAFAKYLSGNAESPLLFCDLNPDGSLNVNGTPQEQRVQGDMTLERIAAMFSLPIFEQYDLVDDAMELVSVMLEAYRVCYKVASRGARIDDSLSIHMQIWARRIAEPRTLQGFIHVAAAFLDVITYTFDASDTSRTWEDGVAFLQRKSDHPYTLNGRLGITPAWPLKNIAEFPSSVLGGDLNAPTRYGQTTHTILPERTVTRGQEMFLPTHLTMSAAQASALALFAASSSNVIWSMFFAGKQVESADEEAVAAPTSVVGASLALAPINAGGRAWRPTMESAERSVDAFDGGEGRFGAVRGDASERGTRRQKLADLSYRDVDSEAYTRSTTVGGNRGVETRHFVGVFRERWDAINRFDSEPLRRVLKLAFLGVPVRFESFNAIIGNDDVFPFGFLLLRPYMRYAMASAILTTAGSQTGETLVGHADFQLADNVVNKMHVGNFTMYLKSVVYKEENVYIADHIMSTGYLGGDNCEFYKYSDNLADQSIFSPSIFACLVPYDVPQAGAPPGWEPELPNPIDITGQYGPNPMLSQLKSTTRSLHYATAPFYSRLFMWQNNDDMSDPDSVGLGNRWNTLCFQGHQNMYNPASGRADLVISNTGHKGDRVYPGCGRVWKGLHKSLQQQNYTSIYGGGSVATITSMAG